MTLKNQTVTKRKKHKKSHRKHHKKLSRDTKASRNDYQNDDYASLFSSSPIVFLDPIDPTADEEEYFYEEEAAVTEVPDSELRRLGFPVGEEEEEEAVEEEEKDMQGSSFLPGLESPFIHFTSRKSGDFCREQNSIFLAAK